MRVEKLVRFLRTKEEDPILQVLLLQLSHLLVHDEGLCEVLELSLALALDLGVDLDEDLEVAGHHIGQGIAAGLHLLQGIVNILDLLLPLQLPLLGLQLIQLLQECLYLSYSLLAQLPYVGPLFKQ